MKTDQRQPPNQNNHMIDNIEKVNFNSIMVCNLMKFLTGFVFFALFPLSIILFFMGIPWGYDAFDTLFVIAILSGAWLFIIMLPFIGGIVYLMMSDQLFLEHYKKAWKILGYICLTGFILMSISEYAHYLGIITSRYELNWNH